MFVVINMVAVNGLKGRYQELEHALLFSTTPKQKAYHGKINTLFRVQMEL